MIFYGKFSFDAGGLRLGVMPDGRLAMGRFAAGDPAAVFLAYDTGAGQVVLQSAQGSWVLLVAAQAPNAWYPVLYAAQTGAYATRFAIGHFDLAAGAAKLVFADDNGVDVALMVSSTINPYCSCMFDVGASAFVGTVFGLAVSAPGVEAINRSHSAIDCDLGPVGTVPVNLAGARFVEVDFSGAHLDRAMLDGAVFLRCDLTRASLAEASLQQADLRATFVAGADFSGCDMTTVSLPDPPLSDAESPRTLLRRATVPAALLQRDWSFLDLTDARLLGLAEADLVGLKARGLAAPGVALTGKALRGADFGLADLRGADFQGADLTAAKLRSTRLNGANFVDAMLREARFEPEPSEASPPPTDLTSARLDGADACGASFASALMGGATLTAAALEDVDFAGTLLGESGQPAASLAYAYLANARFDEASLVGVDLSFATLFGPRVSFLQVRSMARCKLTNAYLCGVDLSGACLDGASLVGACLVNACLDRVRLGLSDGERASLAGATLQGARFRDAQLDWANLSGAAVALTPGVLPLRHCDAQAQACPAPPATLQQVFDPTAGINLDSMGDDTICPNGYTLKQNLQAHRSVHEMLSSSHAPTQWFPASCGPGRPYSPTSPLRIA